jgi:hypothetical protein
VKLTQLAVTAALVMSFGALQAQTVPNPPQKPQSNSLPPPNKSANSAPASPLGAIHRSNPVIVRPPEPNAAEQSYSRDQGFVSQHGTRPDPRISTTPGSGSSQPVKRLPQQHPLNHRPDINRGSVD